MMLDTKVEEVCGAARRSFGAPGHAHARGGARLVSGVNGAGEGMAPGVGLVFGGKALTPVFSRSTGRGGKRSFGRGRSSGFSFTEVLFAVMVLGIGFIMIAAMFPVTIQQTQATLEESVGASMARGALAYLQTQATDMNFPSTSPVPDAPAQVFSMPQAPVKNGTAFAGWFATRGNYINSKNPRLAWVPLYMRSETTQSGVSPFAQVIIVAVEARNMPDYQTADAVPQTNFQSVLEPRPIKVNLTYDYTNLQGRLTITDSKWLAASGAYVIIANDQNTNAPRSVVGQSNGRIYRLGNAIDEANGVWGLSPDGDMIRRNYKTANSIVTGDDNDLSNTDAYIIGRGYADPTKPGNGPDFYSGPAQDIAVYTGFVRINPPVVTP